MKIGVVNDETWAFLHEVYAELSAYHEVKQFKRRNFSNPILNSRINRYLINVDMNAFLRTNEVVFFEWASELLALATHLPKRCGVITRLHRYEMYQWVDKINWRNVDQIILVSHAKKKEFIERFPEQAQKVIVIHEAVDLGKLNFYPKPFNGDIGILCHLTPRKRVYEIILAFYDLTQQMDDFHLHIAGGSRPAHKDYYHALHSIVDELHLQDKVTFYGHVTETNDWYQLIDIFISNSYSEGLQVAPIEAIASGCYCLAHRWAGADELFPEENLFYSSNELIEKIRRYLESSEDEKRRKKEHLRDIMLEKCDIEKTKVDIRRVIEEVGANALQ